MDVFHVSEVVLNPGTILAADKLGHHRLALPFCEALDQGPAALCAAVAAAEYLEIIAGRSPQARRWAAEGVFEHIRQIEFPGSPERWRSVFAFETLELAKRFLEKERRGTVSGVYRCEAEEGAVFRCDMELISAFPQGASIFERLDEVKDRARRYWRRSDPLVFPETLLTGRVQVQELTWLDHIH